MRHLPAPLPRGPPRQAREEPRPLGGHLRRGGKHNVAPYFCVQKDFAPSSSNCRLGASSQLAGRWAERHIQRPPVHLGKQPTPPRREGSFGGRPAEPPASFSRQRQPLPRPARPAAPPADETREEPRGREPSRRSGPAQPTHLPLPGPARSPGPPAPEPVGEGQAPGFHGAEKAAARRTRGGKGSRNPGALGRAAASLSSPPGRLGPSAACASSGWRFGWAGPGSPAPGRPNPVGAQAPSRGRQGAGCGAGRPAGGRAACCGCAGAEIAGDCAVGHSPQSGCATVGLRRGDCDRAGSSQPPATSGNGERCRLCRRRRRRGGGGEGGGTHATHGSASPPGDRHDGEAGAALATPGRGLSAVPLQPPAASSASRAAVQRLLGPGPGGVWMSEPGPRRPRVSCGPKWLLIRRGLRSVAGAGNWDLRSKGTPPHFSPRGLGRSLDPLPERTLPSLIQSPNQTFQRKSLVQSNMVIYSLVIR